MSGLAAVLVATTVALAATSGPSATPVRTYELSIDDPLLLPTSVAVDGQGTVYVADGVNDRVVQFDADGRLSAVVHVVDGEPLRDPFAVDVDPEGALWIVDEQVVARWEPGGGSEVVVWLGSTELGPVDATDIALTSEHLWLVDNDGHRLLRRPLGGTSWEPIACGEPRHPFKLAMTAGGDVFVVDASSHVVRSCVPADHTGVRLGSRGLEPGRYFRPRGLAASDHGVWVSDSVLGSIQLFSPRGAFEGELRSTSGELLLFRSPVDLAASGDRLYVLERDVGRVTELRVGRGSGDSPPDRGRGGRALDGCTVCHLEWAVASGPFAEPVRSAQRTADGPFAGSERACLACHDGTVRDSRRVVWALPGHPLGTELDEGTVTDALPLWQGVIRCRTCHSPHSRAGSGQTQRNALMLRVDDEPSELCLACHGEVREVVEGAHPLGQTSASEDPVRCEDCHVSHGASGPSLLPLDAEDAICTACHPQSAVRPGAHPLAVSLDEESTPAGAVVGVGGELLCATCHAAHRASPALACTGCHPSSAGHGASGSEVSCHDCHPAHEEREGPGLPGDPQDCLRCHAEEVASQASSRDPTGAGHPCDGSTVAAGDPLTCASCHDPHAPATGGDSDCGGCHEAEMASSIGAGHGGLGCQDCHAAHGEPPYDDGLFTDFDRRSRPCLGCHADASAAVSQVEPTAHPPLGGQDLVSRWEPLGLLPLYDAEGQRAAPEHNGQIVCATCHLTHGPDPDQPRDHLRRSGWRTACSACHGEDALWLYRYFHEPERWAW